MAKKYFFAPLFVGGMILANVGWADGSPTQPQQGIAPEQGVGQQEQKVVKQEQGRQEQGLGQQEQKVVKQEQGRQEQGLGQQEQKVGQQEQGRQEMGQQQSKLPPEAPKMIVIRAQKNKAGVEQNAEMFTLNKTIKVQSEQAAQQVIQEIGQQQGVPVQQAQQANVPEQVQKQFEQAEQQSGVGPQDFGRRFRFWNRGVYGYGWQPYWGYNYRYYPTYGYYWNTGFYPYTSYNYYYPYGYYNYYYYYNPYTAW